MINNLIIFFLIPIVYCLCILCLTYFLVYKKIKINLQHVMAFCAGFLTIFILFDLLPYIFSTGNNLSLNIIFIIFGFLVNAITEVIFLSRFKFFNQILPKNLDCHQQDIPHIHSHLIPSYLGCSTVSCFILCSFFDGFRLASIILVDIKMAFIMGIGLLFHLLPECISIIGIGLSSGFSRRSLCKIILIFYFTFLGGYFLSYSLFDIQSLQNFILPFTTGLLIYICLVHFIPMVIKFKIKKWFFRSAAICFILLQLVHIVLHN